jgi:glucan-binding YG repeat protein
MGKFLIIDAKNATHEYTATSVEQALTKYIDEQLVFESGFLLDSAKWNSIVEMQTPLSVKIEVLNGLCKIRAGKVAKVIKDYSYVIAYPDSVDCFTRFGVGYQRIEGADDYYSVHSGDTGADTLVIAASHDGTKVTHITENAFANNRTLSKLYISENITEIDVNAFKNCTNLSQVYFAGTSAKFSKFVSKLPAACRVEYQRKLTGWITINNKHVYYEDNVAATNKWVTLRTANDSYVDENGFRVSNSWVQTGEDWYYVGQTGTKHSGWLALNGIWYYLDPANSNKMVADGWKSINSQDYYFTAGGNALAEAWAQRAGKYYWLDKNCRVAKSMWLKHNGAWYYLKSDGVMAASETLTINSKSYSFDATGRCTNP